MATDSEKIAKLEATLRGLEEDGYPTEVLAGLQKDIASLKGKPSEEGPSQSNINLVRPWSPDGDPTDKSTETKFVREWSPDVADAAPLPPAPPTQRIISGINKLRKESEDGYEVPQPKAPRGLQPSFMDKLRARVNKWTPEQAAADVQRRAEAARELAELEAQEKVRAAERLVEELGKRKKKFAVEALRGAIVRAQRAAHSNADLYEWSGSARRKKIRESTSEMIYEVQEKLDEMRGAGGDEVLEADARALLKELQLVKESFEEMEA